MIVYTYMYTHITMYNKKEAMNLKESKEGFMGKFGRRKWENDIIKS